MRGTRREFLRGLAGSALATPLLPMARLRPAAGFPVLPRPKIGWHGASSLAMSGWDPRALTVADPTPLAVPVPPAGLTTDFPDLPRHFVFEYYPWYGALPIRHWDQWDRVPPDDIATTAVPRLGAYDSLALDVLEQHAKWIAGSGVGAVNLSWWGPGSYEDRAVHRVMDVLGAHGLKITFHLEPYSLERARQYASDVLYLLREYGQRRRFDHLLVLRDRDGSEGPVFKSFRTILPREFTDCHGHSRTTPDYTPDDVWRSQTDGLRQTLAADFDHLTLLADSLDVGRTPRCGFDGIAIYDNFVPPTSYRSATATASRRDLVSSFNVNPGYDAIEPRFVDPEDCYQALPFAPPTEPLDWSQPGDRERAAERSRDRIHQSLAATLEAQSDPQYTNARRGFLLVYLNSWNEWHEGHAFEPMQDAAGLTRGQRAVGYHNPGSGDYRLAALCSELGSILGPPAKTA